MQCPSFIGCKELNLFPWRSQPLNGKLLQIPFLTINFDEATQDNSSPSSLDALLGPQIDHYFMLLPRDSHQGLIMRQAQLLVMGLLLAVKREICTNHIK